MGISSRKGLADTLGDVEVLVEAGSNSVEVLCENPITLLQYFPALGCKQGLPVIDGFVPAEVFLLDEKSLSDAFLEEDAAGWQSGERDSEFMLKPVTGCGPQNEVRQRGIKLAENFFGNVFGESSLRGESTGTVFVLFLGRNANKASVEGYRPPSRGPPKCFNIQLRGRFEVDSQVHGLPQGEGQFVTANFLQPVGIAEFLQPQRRMIAAGQNQP